MKRLFLLLLAAAGSSVVAQNERLEHVLISVPIHKKTAETALPVSLLTGEELRRRAAATLGETLGDKPGIANSSFGPGVGRPVIRGQQGPRAVTLQNGTASADVSGLSPDHGVAVDSLLADGIEVLRGPSTLLYGGGAIGGVVNVVDNRIPRSPVDGFEGALEYRYDDATDTDGGVFRLESGNGAFVFHLSGTAREFEKLDIPGLAIDEAALERQEELLGGEHEEEEEEHEEEELENTDGFVANADGDADTLTGGFSYHFGERGFFGFAVSSLETEYGIPPGAHGHHEEEEGEEHGEDEQEEDEHEEEEHEEEEHGEEEEIVRIDLRQTRYDAQLHWHDFPAGIDVLRAFLTYTDSAHEELEREEVGTRYDRDTWESHLEVVHDPPAGSHGVFGSPSLRGEFHARCSATRGSTKRSRSTPTSRSTGPATRVGWRSRCSTTTSRTTSFCSTPGRKWRRPPSTPTGRTMPPLPASKSRASSGSADWGPAMSAWGCSATTSRPSSTTTATCRACRRDVSEPN